MSSILFGENTVFLIVAILFNPWYHVSMTKKKTAADKAAEKRAKKAMKPEMEPAVLGVAKKTRQSEVESSHPSVSSTRQLPSGRGAGDREKGVGRDHPSLHLSLIHI